MFTGDRVKEELLAFAQRMSGPPVQQVTQMDSFNTLKTQNEIFFAYVGQRNGTLWTAYNSIAEIFQPHGFFYSTSREIADRHFQIDTLPAVLVYKENNHYHFPRNYIYLHFVTRTKFVKLLFLIFNLFRCSLERLSSGRYTVSE